jgi:hypothetical protein
LNSLPPPLSFISLPPIPGIVSIGIIFTFYVSLLTHTIWHTVIICEQVADNIVGCNL